MLARQDTGARGRRRRCPPKSEKGSRAVAAVPPADRPVNRAHPRSKVGADARGGAGAGRARRSSSLAAPAPARARAPCCRCAGDWSAACFLVSGSDASVFPSHAHRKMASSISGPAVVEASWTRRPCNTCFVVASSHSLSVHMNEILEGHERSTGPILMRFMKFLKKIQITATRPICSMGCITWVERLRERLVGRKQQRKPSSRRS